MVVVSRRDRNPAGGGSCKSSRQLEVPLFWFFVLHFALILNSMTGVASKFAGRAQLFSFRFFVLYGTALFLSFSFAILWQQVLKRMSLTFAYMNKPITVIYSLIWGKFLFSEQVTGRMVIGALVILCGILVGVSDRSSAGPESGGKNQAGTSKAGKDKAGKEARA